MSKHMKRYSAPKFWKIPKKEKVWTVTPRPGPHKKFESIPLLILVRDVLKIVDSAKDAKKIIKNRELLIDGRERIDQKYPVGLFDVIEIPKLKKYYRLVPSCSGLKIIDIPKEEAKLKLCRINNKTPVRGGNLQLNLHDGRNIVLKEKKEYKTGDSLLIELPSQKILDHLRMEEEMLAIIAKGKNAGKIVKIKKVIITRSREPNKLICEKEGKMIEAMKDNVFVIGKNEPLIKVG